MNTNETRVSYLWALTKGIHTPPRAEILFAEKVLGLPVLMHTGQSRWLENARKRINILHPGNKYGKSIIGAVRHIYHHFTKVNVHGLYNTVDEFMRIKYDTLNFGPGYEQAREILRMVRDICQGNVFLPRQVQEEYGVMNNSFLKDWFIISDHSDSQVLPYIEFYGGGKLYGRSYSEMGAAFKMKGVAYVSGDEVADIQELWAFTNATLLPRGVAYQNFSIDYYGTPQAEGHDYMRMIEMGETDMRKPDWNLNGMFYVQKGSMFENPFLDKDTVKAIENISDPTLRRQVIYGEYVETGDKYFGFERIQNAIDKNIKLLDRGLPGRKYIVTCDFAGGESYWSDYTIIMVIDYTEEPYRVVYFKRSKGADIPIPMQYKLVEEVVNSFRTGSLGAKLIIDSSALGGKNALAFLRHLNPIQFEAVASRKAEMLATLKIAFDGGQTEHFRRKLKQGLDGKLQDVNPTWGAIRIPDIPELYQELQNYKADDSKIRTDSVMALGQAIHYLEMRRPKQIKKGMVSFDLVSVI